MQTQLTPGAGAGLAPSVKDGKQFLADWLVERGLDESCGVFEPSAFGIAAFKIVTHDKKGTPKPELSRTRHDRADKKYMAQSGVGVIIFAPLPDSYEKFAVAKEKWIAEGEGKALALAALGLPVLGIGGVRGWHLKGQEILHPDLAESIHPGDVVHVAIDGDVATNPDVRLGAGLLLIALKAQRAKPFLLHLPRDLGVDDQIAQWKREDKNPLAELAKLPRSSELRLPTDIPLTSYAAIIERPPAEWIVKGLIPPGELTAIVGETSCGKTFLTMDLLLAVARGSEYWFGQRVKRHGLVVHITLEGTGLGNRLRAYHTHHEISGGLPYRAIEVPLNLRDAGTTDDLIRSIDHERVLSGLPLVLVAVDTVNRALGGGDENSSVDMGALLNSAERIKAAFPGCGVLLVHHKGKNISAGARGHSSFSANVGAELDVEASDRGIRTVTLTKQREASTTLSFNFSLAPVVLGKDSDGDEITSCVVEAAVAPPDTTETDIHELIYRWNLTENRGQTTCWEDLRTNKGRILGKGRRMRIDDFKNALEGLVNRGQITRTKLPRGGASLTIHQPAERKY